MSGKRWVIFVGVIFILQVILLEVFYQTSKHNRHEVDYLVNNTMQNLKNKKYDVIILGDSLAHKTIGSIELHNNILDLTSNNAVSMAGNFFLFQRYLKDNYPPKKLYLFCVPNHLYQNLDTIHTYFYFSTIFTKDSEKKEIKKLKPHLYDYSFSKYTESRIKSIDFLGYFNPKAKVLPKEIDESSLEREDNFINDSIREKIEEAKINIDKINEIPKIYLDKLIAITKKYDIEFTLVIEPIPIESHNVFLSSKMYQYIKSKNINIIDINNIYQFSNYSFKIDGRHLDGKDNQYFQNIIDKKVIDIY